MQCCIRNVTLIIFVISEITERSRELIEIADDLREVFELPKGGDLPVRSCGTRWISQKRKALQQILDRYGVYIHHLTTLCQYTSIKGDDRARLKGYLWQWQHAKNLVGCVMFIDAMKPASLLSLTLQELNTDIVLCIEQILKTFKSLTNLQAKDPREWPSVKLVKERMKVVSEESQYQGVKLMLYNQITLENCKKDVLNDLQCLSVKLKERLEWSDTQLLRSFLVF